LLSFVLMNCTHNGNNLGQVLYVVCNWLQIVQKVSISVSMSILVSVHLFTLASHVLIQVGHVTCNNAKNNDTMMQDVADDYLTMPCKAERKIELS
jgi:hypothetical protein